MRIENGIGCQLRDYPEDKASNNPPILSMQLIDEPLPGVKVLKPFIFEDARGNFVKPFHEDQLLQHEISMTVREEFYSTSAKNVLRGMHFQIPPHAHQKLVYCISGEVIDVLLDLRRKSPTYGKAVSINISYNNKHVLYIPKGIAHGFLSLRDNTCLIYKTDAVHSNLHDKGIAWNSFGFEWPSIEPIISVRDLSHTSFLDFSSPF